MNIFSTWIQLDLISLKTFPVICVLNIFIIAGITVGFLSLTLKDICTDSIIP